MSSGTNGGRWLWRGEKVSFYYEMFAKIRAVTMTKNFLESPRDSSKAVLKTMITNRPVFGHPPMKSWYQNTRTGSEKTGSKGLA